MTGSVFPIINCRDLVPVRGFYEQVFAAEPAGGAVVTPPADTPWGERVAYLRDPQGTMLLVIQEPAATDSVGSLE